VIGLGFGTCRVRRASTYYISKNLHRLTRCATVGFLSITRSLVGTPRFASRRVTLAEERITPTRGFASHPSGFGGSSGEAMKCTAAFVCGALVGYIQCLELFLLVEHVRFIVFCSHTWSRLGACSKAWWYSCCKKSAWLAHSWPSSGYIALGLTDG
jgi:hypothetical protein